MTISEWVSTLNDRVTVSERAETFDEAFYQEMYDWKCGLYGSALMIKNKKRGKKYKEFCRREFEQLQNNEIAIYKEYLPPHILDEIADIRVFALGYASAEVKQMLPAFCDFMKNLINYFKNKGNAEPNSEDQTNR